MNSNSCSYLAELSLSDIGFEARFEATPLTESLFLVMKSATFSSSSESGRIGFVFGCLTFGFDVHITFYGLQIFCFLMFVQKFAPID